MSSGWIIGKKNKIYLSCPIKRLLLGKFAILQYNATWSYLDSNVPLERSERIRGFFCVHKKNGSLCCWNWLKYLIKVDYICHKTTHNGNGINCLENQSSFVCNIFLCSLKHFVYYYSMTLFYSIISPKVEKLGHSSCCSISDLSIPHNWP